MEKLGKQQRQKKKKIMSNSASTPDQSGLYWNGMVNLVSRWRPPAATAGAEEKSHDVMDACHDKIDASSNCSHSQGDNDHVRKAAAWQWLQGHRRRRTNSQASPPASVAKMASTDNHHHVVHAVNGLAPQHGIDNVIKLGRVFDESGMINHQYKMQVNCADDVSGMKAGASRFKSEAMMGSIKPSLFDELDLISVNARMAKAATATTDTSSTNGRPPSSSSTSKSTTMKEKEPSPACSLVNGSGDVFQKILRRLTMTNLKSGRGGRRSTYPDHLAEKGTSRVKSHSARYGHRQYDDEDDDDGHGAHGGRTVLAETLHEPLHHHHHHHHHIYHHHHHYHHAAGALADKAFASDRYPADEEEVEEEVLVKDQHEVHAAAASSSASDQLEDHKYVDRESAKMSSSRTTGGGARRSPPRHGSVYYRARRHSASDYIHAGQYVSEHCMSGSTEDDDCSTCGGDLGYCKRHIVRRRGGIEGVDGAAGRDQGADERCGEGKARRSGAGAGGCDASHRRHSADCGTGAGELAAGLLTSAADEA